MLVHDVGPLVRAEGASIAVIAVWLRPCPRCLTAGVPAAVEVPSSLNATHALHAAPAPVRRIPAEFPSVAPIGAEPPPVVRGGCGRVGGAI